MIKNELKPPAPITLTTMYLLLQKRGQEVINLGNKFFGNNREPEFNWLVYLLDGYKDCTHRLVRSLKYDFYGRENPVELSKEYARQAKIFDKSWNENESTGTQLNKINTARKVNALVRKFLGIDYDAIININGKFVLAHSLRPENIDLEALFPQQNTNKKKSTESNNEQPLLLLKAPEQLVDQKRNKLTEIQLNEFINFEKKHGFLSRTKELLKVYNLIQSSGDDLEVLITGESGVGKELIAKAIHKESNRKSGPFIAENCAGQTNLINNLLFGHEKGSFTDSVGVQIGIIEQANHGTLFLDEIGDMTLNMQSRLLRVLQNKVIKRIGGSKEIKIDFRLICATNKNLENEIEQGRFREDLYYRINVLPIHVPPLRERLNDIPYLANYFFIKSLKENTSSDLYSKLKWITNTDFNPLMTIPWKGNARQLENFIRRFVIIHYKDFPRLKPGMLRQIFEDQTLNISDLLESESHNPTIFRSDKYLEILLAYFNNRCNINETSKKQALDRDTVRSRLRSSLLQLGSNFDFNENKMAKYLIDSHYIDEEKKTKLVSEIIDIFKKTIKLYKNKDAKQYFHRPDEALVIQISLIRAELA